MYTCISVYVKVQHKGVLLIVIVTSISILCRCIIIIIPGMYQSVLNLCTHTLE